MLFSRNELETHLIYLVHGSLLCFLMLLSPIIEHGLVQVLLCLKQLKSCHIPALHNLCADQHPVQLTRVSVNQQSKPHFALIERCPQSREVLW